VVFLLTARSVTSACIDWACYGCQRRRCPLCSQCSGYRRETREQIYWCASAFLCIIQMCPHITSVFLPIYLPFSLSVKWYFYCMTMLISSARGLAISTAFYPFLHAFEEQESTFGWFCYFLKPSLLCSTSTTFPWMCGLGNVFWVWRFSHSGGLLKCLCFCHICISTTKFYEFLLLVQISNRILMCLCRREGLENWVPVYCHTVETRLSSYSIIPFSAAFSYIVCLAQRTSEGNFLFWGHGTGC